MERACLSCLHQPDWTYGMLCWTGFCERAWRGVFRLADADLTGMPEVTWQDTFYEPVRCHFWTPKEEGKG